MLIIREEQLLHFIAADETELLALLAEVLRAVCPERVAEYEDEKLAAMIKRAAERAHARGFKRAPDVAVFVALMFEIAPTFDEQEQIKLVLADTNFPLEERLKQLPARVTEEAWQEAEKMYTAKFWFPDAE